MLKFDTYRVFLLFLALHFDDCMPLHSDYPVTTECPATKDDCASGSNGRHHPLTFSNFSKSCFELLPLGLQNNPKRAFSQPKALAACKTFAPAGFRGRLAILNEDMYDVFKGKNLDVWIGGKSKEPNPSWIRKPFSPNEWDWADEINGQTTKTFPITWFPFGSASDQRGSECLHLFYNWFDDESCTAKLSGFICEYVKESCNIKTETHWAMPWTESWNYPTEARTNSPENPKLSPTAEAPTESTSSSSVGSVPTGNAIHMCSNHGHMVCHCEEGYTGTHCETELNKNTWISQRCLAFKPSCDDEHEEIQVGCPNIKIGGKIVPQHCVPDNGSPIGWCLPA